MIVILVRARINLLGLMDSVSSPERPIEDVSVIERAYLVRSFLFNPKILAKHY
jgi:hypothetical protein